jgi:hypothetical protein
VLLTRQASIFSKQREFTKDNRTGILRGWAPNCGAAATSFKLRGSIFMLAVAQNRTQQPKLLLEVLRSSSRLFLLVSVVAARWKNCGNHMTNLKSGIITGGAWEIRDDTITWSSASPSQIC